MYIDTLFNLNFTTMKTLEIYMKSGNKIIADKVSDWDIKYNSNQITSLSVQQKTEGYWSCKNRLLVGSIDLKQIECIVERD